MTTRTLDSRPGLLPLYLRAALPLVPGAARLPGLPGGGRSIPDLELAVGAVEVERAQLDAYCDTCGFARGGALPPTFPHVLAFPLHMALMTDARFPFSPVGLVHIANEIVQERPLLPSEPLDLSVSVSPLEPHPKGHTFEILTLARVRTRTHAYARDGLLWQERSTMLRRGKPAASAPSAAAPEPPSGSELWEVPADTGRRYAAASGDRNPIHLHALSARAFGFRHAIAHGMWAKARCLARLQRDLPGGFTVAVEFRKPILLPATVAFGSERATATTAFALRDPESGALHLSGRVERTEG